MTGYNHGGTRRKAGRPKGTFNPLRTVKLARDLLERGKSVLGEKDAPTPLDYLLQIMWDKNNDFSVRYDAAKSAAPYCHPRLSAVAVSNPEDNKITIVFRDLSKPKSLDALPVLASQPVIDLIAEEIADPVELTQLIEE